MRIASVLVAHRKLIIFLVLLAALTLALVVGICHYKIEPYKRFILSPHASVHAKVGLVLGAGIMKDGTPHPILQARLDAAADALEAGVIDKLILSGDNRFSNYDEPTAMKRYLVEHRKITSGKLALDYAGRSTYESCERAAKVFMVKKVILFSASSHLPRAIYLCRHFNIETYGIASSLEANNSTRRELLARVKAVYNVHVAGEPTVLGNSIPLE